MKRRRSLLLVALGAIAAAWTVRARATAPLGRYTYPPGVLTVTDTKTGLTWERVIVPKKFSPDAAAAHCSETGAILGGTGWRVPTIWEIQTLVDDGIASPGPTIDQTAFPSTPTDGIFMSPTGGAQGTWGVSFLDGMTVQLDAGPFYVRCVR